MSINRGRSDIVLHGEREGNRRPKRDPGLLGPAFAFAALVGLGLFLFGTDVGSQQAPPNNGAQPTQAQNAQGNAPEPLEPNRQNANGPKRDQETHWYNTFLDHPTEWLIALFNGLLVWAVVKQSGLIRQSIKTQTTDMAAYVAQAEISAIAMKSVSDSMSTNVEKLTESVGTTKTIAARQKAFSERQMRAYISVQVGSFFDQTESVTVQCHPTFFNSGHTPAHQVRFVGRVVLSDFPTPTNFDFTLPAPESREITIGPSQWRQMPFFAERFYTPEEIAEYRAGTRKRIYCFGQVFYDDDFGVGHFTNFGFSIVLDAANKPVAIWTERHNETDRTAPVE